MLSVFVSIRVSFSFALAFEFLFLFLLQFVVTCCRWHGTSHLINNLFFIWHWYFVILVNVYDTQRAGERRNATWKRRGGMGWGRDGRDGRYTPKAGCNLACQFISTSPKSGFFFIWEGKSLFSLLGVGRWWRYRGMRNGFGLKPNRWEWNGTEWNGTEWMAWMDVCLLI